MRKLLLTLLLSISALCLRAETVAPQFPGGDEALAKYLKETVKYPKRAADYGVEGIVKVRITVLADGELKDTKVVTPIDPDLEAEALRVVAAMPRWIPASADGVPVEDSAIVEVTFLLD